MSEQKMHGRWMVKRYYGNDVLCDDAQINGLHELIRAHIDTRAETLSRLARAAWGASSNGTELHEFLNGRRHMSPSRADRVVHAIERFPKGFPKVPAKPAVAFARSPEYRMQKELNANREAAEQRRAAHIEACRQAEIAKYGFTTIDRDVMEMVA